MPTRRFNGRRYAGPVIAQNAITDYLQRPLEEFDWIKRVPRDALLESIGDFKLSAAYTPFLHQLQCFALGVEFKQFMFLLDMGGGKTAVSLALFKWHRARMGFKRMLIMVPKEVNIQSWIDEIQLHAPDLSYIALVGSTEERQRLVFEEADLFLINYAGLQVLMTDLQTVRRKKKRKREIIPKMAKQLAQRFGMVVFDESHRAGLGNMHSLLYRECRYFTKFTPVRYGLTGTPFGRDPTPLWSQFHVVDNGATLGDSLGLFKAAFFNAVETPWAIKHVFDERMQDDLHKMIKHRSIYYRDKEFSDLPPFPVPKKINCPFTVSAKEQYRNVVKRIQQSYGSSDELKDAFVRMRMCTSGFLSVKSEIEGRLTMYFDENPKMDALEELVHDIPLDTKAIIFHDYILTGNLICKMLRRNKLRYVTLNGRTEDQMGEMRKFLHDDSVRYLVANNETGSTGINPQHVASYAIFYEAPVSPTTRKQAIKRLHRQGQKKRVHIYDLVVPNSVDGKILRFLKEGKNLFDAVITGGKSAIKLLVEDEEDALPQPRRAPRLRARGAGQSSIAG
jgi:SNF2 family DNA or RNA helicase